MLTLDFQTRHWTEDAGVKGPKSLQTGAALMGPSSIFPGHSLHGGVQRCKERLQWPKQNKNIEEDNDITS